MVLKGWKAAVQSLQSQAAESVRAGATILILSDRILLGGVGGVGGVGGEITSPTASSSPTSSSPSGVSTEYTYIPPLLAVGAVHHHLIREGLRMKASLVVETAQCWSTHHFACLIGYGAAAVCPYLALDTVDNWWFDPKTQQFMERGKIPAISLEQARKNYCQAVESGLLKILSKMGISLISSYQGAQIFEAIGIGQDLLELGFFGTISRVGGLSVSELAVEVLSFHSKAFPELTTKKLENFGFC